MRATLDKNNISDIIGLTPQQMGIFYHYLSEPAGIIYNIQITLKISGEINLLNFKKAWEFVVAANEMLRVVYRWDNLEKPVQIILKENDLRIDLYDLSDCDDQLSRLNRVKQDDRTEIFNLLDVPFRLKLCTLSFDQYMMIISYHHILFDGWSLGIILKEFNAAYNRLCSGEKLKAVRKGVYKDYVKYLLGKEKALEAKYWKEYLRDFDFGASYLRENPDVDRSIEKIAKIGCRFSGWSHEEIQKFTRLNEVTLAGLLYAAWGILLKKYKNSDDLIFGITLSGRNLNLNDADKIVGMFVNTLPLRIKLRADESLMDILKATDAALKSIDYTYSSLAKIKEYSNLTGEGNLFNNIIVFENYPVDWGDFKNSNLGLEFDSVAETTNYDLTVVANTRTEFEIEFFYKTSCFSDDFIRNIAVRLRKIIETMAEKPEMKLNQLSVLSDAEFQKLIYGYNNTFKRFCAKTIHEIFEEQVKKTPNNNAIDQDGLLFTYKEINIKANQLAGILQKAKVGPDSIVGVMVERSAWMVIGCLAVLKAGGAYLPIDIEYPKDRIEYILNDSKADIILTTADLSGADYGRQTFFLDNEQLYTGDGSNPASSSIASNLAYAIYTSGSTGNPKGVMIEHKSAVNYLNWAIKNYITAESANFPLFTSLSFDLTVTSLFAPLLSGNTLIIYKSDDQEVLLEKIIRENKADVVKLTPSHLQLVSEIEVKDSRISRFILGGENLSAQLAQKVFEKFNERVEIINEYGPTEATVGCMIHRFDSKSDKSKKYVPIGVPAANCRIYLLDENKNPVPPGVPGEMYISGDCLARGYINNPKLTSERFLSDPFHPNSRMYKTGDWARRFHDGCLEFLNRKDNQVKIRGYRVELGEIENKISELAFINEAVVLDLNDENNEKNLVAYYTTYNKTEENSKSLSLEIKRFLASKLPCYMVPSCFIPIGEMPLTLNGKIDKQALADIYHPNETNKYIRIDRAMPPEGYIEKKLLEITSSVCNIKDGEVGLEANFLELGGHSLKAASLKLRIKKELNTDISLKQILDSVTLKELATHIKNSIRVQYVPISPAPQKDYYNVSHAQKRIWLLSQANHASLSFNMQGILAYDGHFETDVFENVLKTLYEYYEILRTVFIIADGEVKQKILPFSDAFSKFDLIDLSSESDMETNIGNIAVSERNKLFDLSAAPLLRTTVIKLGAMRYKMIFTLHHIIGDHVSCEIIKRKIITLYEAYKTGSGNPFEPLKIQYKDFAEWENTRMEADTVKLYRNYWVGRFNGYSSDDYLQLDFERPKFKTYKGEEIFFSIPAQHLKGLKEISGANGSSLFITILTAIKILLYNYSAKTDITVGIPVSVREHPDLEDQVGLYLNTLPLRTGFLDTDKFSDVLKKVKEAVTEAMVYQNYPFDLLIENLNLKRDMRRHPLFDIMIDMINIYETPDNHLNWYQEFDLGNEDVLIKEGNSKFDLTIYVFERSNDIIFSFEYSTDIFSQKTIWRMIRRFKSLLGKLVKYQNMEINDIDPDEEIILPIL
jgi:amino acid adenylation domain-containing protein